MHILLFQRLNGIVVAPNSCSRNHSGIYFISNQQDFDIASRELISRIKKLSRRHKCLRLNWQDWKGEIVKEQLTLSRLGK